MLLVVLRHVVRHRVGVAIAHHRLGEFETRPLLSSCPHGRYVSRRSRQRRPAASLRWRRDAILYQILLRWRAGVTAGRRRQGELRRRHRRLIGSVHGQCIVRHGLLLQAGVHGRRDCRRWKRRLPLMDASRLETAVAAVLLLLLRKMIPVVVMDVAVAVGRIHVGHVDGLHRGGRFHALIVRWRLRWIA